MLSKKGPNIILKRSTDNIYGRAGVLFVLLTMLLVAVEHTNGGLCKACHKKY